MSNHQAAPSDESILADMASVYKGGTLSNYLARVRRIVEVCDAVCNTPDYKIACIASRPIESFKCLGAAYQNRATLKNMVTVVLSVMKASKELSAYIGPAVKQKWTSLHEDIEKTVRTGSKMMSGGSRSEGPSERSSVAVITAGEIRAKYDALVQSHGQGASDQEVLLLSVFLHVCPQDLDMHNMKIYTDRDKPSGTSNSGERYIIMRTAKVGGSTKYLAYWVDQLRAPGKEMLLGPTFTRDLINSLKINHRSNMFVTRFGKPYTSQNAFSKFVLRSTQSMFGKKGIGLAALQQACAALRVEKRLSTAKS